MSAVHRVQRLKTRFGNGLGVHPIISQQSITPQLSGRIPLTTLSERRANLTCQVSGHIHQLPGSPDIPSLQ